jgi:hypothetical protein
LAAKERNINRMHYTGFCQADNSHLIRADITAGTHSKVSGMWTEKCQTDSCVAILNVAVARLSISGLFICGFATSKLVRV